MVVVGKPFGTPTTIEHSFPDGRSVVSVMKIVRASRWSISWMRQHHYEASEPLPYPGDLAGHLFKELSPPILGK